MFLEPGEDAKRVPVSLDPHGRASFVQRLLAAVPERPMTEIMRQARLCGWPTGSLDL